MKKVMLALMAVLVLAGCHKGQGNEAKAEPQPVAAAEPVDYRQLAMLTMAAINRSADLFAKLGDSDQTIYHRDIYNPAMRAADAWPKPGDTGYKQVPDALWDCQEAAVSWVSYLDRATMKNPPDLVIAEAQKDMARVQEKTRLCDTAISDR
jgi:hypothetical protein